MLLLFFFMLFQGAEGEQPPPSTHQWQHHPSAIIHMIVWNGYPTSFVAAVQLASDKLLLSLLAWMRKGYGNPDGVSFWRLGLHFLCPAQFLEELVHPITSETGCDPALHSQLCRSSCKHPSSTASLVIFFNMAFSLTEICFNVSVF